MREIICHRYKSTSRNGGSPKSLKLPTFNRPAVTFPEGHRADRAGHPILRAIPGRETGGSPRAAACAGTFTDASSGHQRRRSPRAVPSAPRARLLAFGRARRCNNSPLFRCFRYQKVRFEHLVQSARFLRRRFEHFRLKIRTAKFGRLEMLRYVSRLSDSSDF